VQTKSSACAKPGRCVGDGLDALLGDRAGELDLFDRLQNWSPVLKICRQSITLRKPDAKLYAVSRQGKKQANDADRLRKYWRGSGWIGRGKAVALAIGGSDF